MTNRLHRPALALALLTGAFVGLGGFTFVYGQGASYFANDPRACANCHIMRDQLASWQKSSHHAVATCNDCHTPHELIPKYLSKAENGFRHSKAFTLQDFPEPIRIRAHNLKVVNHNCATCHADLVSEISASYLRPRAAADCARCHRGAGHAAPL